MKKIILLTGLLLTAQSAISQIRPFLETGFNNRINEKINAYNALIPFENLEKNNSFDGPLSIEKYSVTGGVLDLENYYEFTYSPSGVLVSKTTYNDNMAPVERVIYNRDGSGRIVTVISQTYSGGWLFDGRTNYEFTQNRRTQVKWEDYNSGLGVWELEKVVNYEYVGGYDTPSFINTFASYDNINFTPERRVRYLYDSENKPTLMEVQQYDQNYLTFIPNTKWLVAEWGPTEFYPDFLLSNSFYDNLNSTDLITSKFDYYSIYPKLCNVYENYDFLTQSYAFNHYINGSTYNSDNQRTFFNVDEVTPTDTLPVNQVSHFYDPCYGFSKTLIKNYNGGAYELIGGFSFEGETVPYQNSCYVTSYNFFNSFSAGNPSGTWEYRYVINQQNNLAVDHVSNQQFKLFPNPATNSITIESANILTGNVEVLDLNGSVLSSTTMNGIYQTIDISTLPNGVYFLRLQTESSFETQRFIKN